MPFLASHNSRKKLYFYSDLYYHNGVDENFNYSWSHVYNKN